MQELFRDVAIVVWMQGQSVLMLVIALHVVAQRQDFNHDACRVFPRPDELVGGLQMRGVAAVQKCAKESAARLRELINSDHRESRGGIQAT